jgi:hypothetical protein
MVNSIILLLALVGCVTAIGRPTFPLTTLPHNAAVVVVGKPTSKTEHAKLAVRGGAGPIDPQALAKWTTGMNLVNSIYTYLLPDKVREVYKIPYSPLSTLIFQRHGIVLLACTLLAYCLLFQETSVETAVGVSTLPFIIDYARSELAGEPKKFGWGPMHSQLVPLAFAAVTCYGCLNSKDWANTTMKVYSVWLAMNGVLAGFAPDSFEMLWYVKLTDIQKHGFQWRGFFLLDYAVYIGCLAWGVAPMKALGYAWVPATLANVYFNVLSNTTKDFGMNRPMLFAWMVLGIVITATLSFD